MCSVEGYGFGCRPSNPPSGLGGALLEFVALHDAVLAIVLFDPQTLQFVDFNDEAYRRLGYSREEFATLTIADFEVVESPETVRQHVDTIAQTGRDQFETKHRTVVGHGRAEFVEDAADKRRALDLIVAQFSDQTFDYPENTVRNTVVVRIEIETIKGKKHGFGKG